MGSTVALAAITGGSAVAGAFIGAASGHYTTLRSQKLKAQEERFLHRQTVYGEFLDCAHEFIHSAGVRIAAKSGEEWADWFRDFETRLTSVQLFGTRDVRTQAMAFKKTIEMVLRSTQAIEGDSIEEKRGTAFRKHEDEVTAAYDNVVAAMRQDVGTP